MIGHHLSCDDLPLISPEDIWQENRLAKSVLGNFFNAMHTFERDPLFHQRPYSPFQEAENANIQISTEYGETGNSILCHG